MMGHRWWLAGLLAALLTAGLLSPWAAPWPDGLDRVAERLGFRNQARERPLVSAPLADYKLPGVHHTNWSTAAAGVTGTLVVFGGACLLGFALTRRRSG
jgi:cobalt/nickel transport protein